MARSLLVAALLLPASSSALQNVRLPRRAVLGGLATAAISSQQPALFAPLPASAASAFTTELNDAEGALNAAKTTTEVTDALERLLNLVEDYGGLPTQDLTTQLVGVMRSKRTSLQGKSDVWNGIPEEAYNKLMRSIDPWRTTELEPALARSIYTFPFAYAALLVVQQVLPKAFRLAYGGAAFLVLGPLLFSIIVG